MDADKFHETFEGLTRQQRRILEKLLSGEKDQYIAESLQIDRTTVRKHIEAICKAFALKNLPGERYSKRLELISLFCQYRPELVQQNMLSTDREATQHQPTSGRSQDPKNSLYQEKSSPSDQHDTSALSLRDGFVAYDSAQIGRDDLHPVMVAKLMIPDDASTDNILSHLKIRAFIVAIIKFYENQNDSAILTIDDIWGILKDKSRLVTILESTPETRQYIRFLEGDSGECLAVLISEAIANWRPHS